MEARTFDQRSKVEAGGSLVPRQPESTGYKEYIARPCLQKRKMKAHDRQHLMACARLEERGQDRKERSVRRLAVSSPGRASGGGGAGELGSRCATGGAQKQLIDVTEKDKGGQEDFRAHAQIVEDWNSL